MKRLGLGFLFTMLVLCGKGQSRYREVSGEVNFITSQNIYARFSSTSGIEKGDTLYLKYEGALVPCFIAEYLSSVSCSGKPIDHQVVKIGDQIVAQIVANNQPDKPEKKSEEHSVRKVAEQKKDSSEVKPKKWPQVIDGRISALSYLNFSNAGSNDDQRLRYNLSLHANHLGNTGLSVESYLSFTHNLYDWNAIRDNVFSGLKIYNLSAGYDFGSSAQVWIGRRINPRVSNLGAVDGLQMEVGSKKIFAGVIAGFRPDYSDYGFNSNMLEYGGYLGYQFRKGNRSLQTSLAFFRQTNQGNTDRQFLYFQQSNTLIKDVQLFFSGEIDLFRIENNQVSYRPGLTSLYCSLGYRMNRKFSVFASYDARKNVIYYETFKSNLDQMLEEATRQGVSLRLTYRPWKPVITGLSGSYRFLQGDIRTTETLYGYLTWQKVPLISVPVTLSANWLRNSYMDGMVYSLRTTKDFLKGKLSGDADFRYVDYLLTNQNTPVRQVVGELGIRYQLTRKLSFSIDYEGAFESVNRYHRIFMNLSLRF